LEILGSPGSTRIEFSDLYASLFDNEDSFDKQLAVLGLQGESPERIVTRKWMIYPSLGLTVSVSWYVVTVKEAGTALTPREIVHREKANLQGTLGTP
jgi:hypothetical protein